jgi:hypothetical protein
VSEDDTITSPLWLSDKALLFNSLIGLIGLTFIFAEIFGFMKFDRILYPGHLRWAVANLIFFNTIHVAFTLVLLRTSNEFSTRMKRVKTKIKWFFPFLAATFIFIFILFMTRKLTATNAQLVAIFAVTVPQFHVISQHKGLCLNLISDSKWRSLTKELWKYAIYFLTMTSVIMLWSTPSWVGTAITAGAFIIFLSLVGTSYWAMKVGNTKKWSPYLFHMKLLMFPFVFISSIASFVLICLHGVEYISVVSSHVDYRALKKDLMGLLGILGFTVFIIIITWIAVCEHIWTFGGVLTNALLMSTVVMHYALDGVLFRSPNYYAIAPIASSTATDSPT